jgi:gas vesicle protein
MTKEERFYAARSAANNALRGAANGAVLGASVGVLGKGIYNKYKGEKFLKGAGKAALIGGAVGGAVGGAHRYRESKGVENNEKTYREKWAAEDREHERNKKARKILEDEFDRLREMAFDRSLSREVRNDYMAKSKDFYNKHLS